MRNRAKNATLSVQAIAGSAVVLLGMNIAENAVSGLLGFAIHRIDHTEGEENIGVSSAIIELHAQLCGIGQFMVKPTA